MDFDGLIAAGGRVARRKPGVAEEGVPRASNPDYGSGMGGTIGGIMTPLSTWPVPVRLASAKFGKPPPP